MKSLLTFPFIFLLISIVSCSVIKSKYSEKTDSLSRREESRSQQLSLSNTLQQQRVKIFSDSSGEEYQTEIIPDGPFQYSAKNGFSGKALRVLIRGSLRAVSLTKDSSATVSGQKADLKSTAAEKQLNQVSSQTKSKEVTRNRPGMVFLLVVFVIIGVLLFLYVKYRHCLAGIVTRVVHELQGN